MWLRVCCEEISYWQSHCGIYNMIESFIMQAGESTNQICNFLCHSVTAITQTGNDNLLHLETSRKQV